MTQRGSKRDVLPIAGFMLAVAGIVYQSGQLAGKVDQNASRITKIEAAEDARTDRIQAIDVRTARIEAKLDLLKPEGGVR